MAPTDLETRSIDTTSERGRRDASSLVTMTLGAVRTWEDVARATRVLGVKSSSLYVGAFRGASLVGLLSCVAHELVEGGRTTLAHQACRPMVARGEDAAAVSSALLREATRCLEPTGSAFLFALVAETSRAPYQAAGFRDRGEMLESIVPLGRVGASWSLRPLGLDDFVILDDGYRQNDAQLLASAHARDGASAPFSFNGNILWGAPEKGRLPVLGRSFAVGGVIVGDARHLRRAIASALRETGATHARFRFHRTSGLRSLFRRTGPAKSGERLFVKDLARQTGDETRFHFSAGIEHDY